MTELDDTILAYYLATAAKDLTMAGRWYPLGELTLIVEDKIVIAARPFGRKVTGQAKPAATRFVETMIDKGGFATKQNEYGGSMHQYQADAYPKVRAEWQDADPIVQASKVGGESFWADRFAALIGK